MRKKDWISPDDYHLEDLLARGRCLRCGKLAHPHYNNEHKGRKYKSCSHDCGIIIHDTIDELQ